VKRTPQFSLRINVDDLKTIDSLNTSNQPRNHFILKVAMSAIERRVLTYPTYQCTNPTQVNVTGIDCLKVMRFCDKHNLHRSAWLVNLFINSEDQFNKLCQENNLNWVDIQVMRKFYGVFLPDRSNWQKVINQYLHSFKYPTQSQVLIS